MSKHSHCDCCSNDALCSPLPYMHPGDGALEEAGLYQEDIHILPR